MSIASPTSTFTPGAVTFIDGGLAAIDALIAGLPAGSAYFVLDPARDGLQQMADILAGYGGLQTIHVISHGAAGSLALGAARLDQAALDGYAGVLARIGRSLRGGGGRGGIRVYPTLGGHDRRGRGGFHRPDRRPGRAGTGY